MRTRSLPESPNITMMPELQFSPPPPEATLANVFEANSPTLARENKTMFGGGRVSTTSTPHVEDDDAEAQRG